MYKWQRRWLVMLAYHQLVISLLALAARDAAARVSAARRQLEQRIVGGSYIDITEAPYQVSILGDFRTSCGGVIVGPTTVLTAAHCIGFGLIATDNFEVRAGTTLRDTGGTVHAPTMIQCHPLSELDTPHSDIAVVYVEPPFRFDKTRQPINITTKQPRPGEMVTLTGWGRLIENVPKQSVRLTSVTVPVTNVTTCLSYYRLPAAEFADREFCAGALRQGSCVGDSGSPVVRDDELVGLVSYGWRCSESGRPGAHVNLAARQIYTWLQQAL